MKGLKKVVFREKSLFFSRQNPRKGKFWPWKRLSSRLNALNFAKLPFPISFYALKTPFKRFLSLRKLYRGRFPKGWYSLFAFRTCWILRRLNLLSGLWLRSCQIYSIFNHYTIKIKKTQLKQGRINENSRENFDRINFIWQKSNAKIKI